MPAKALVGVGEVLGSRDVCTELKVRAVTFLSSSKLQAHRFRASVETADRAPGQNPMARYLDVGLL